MILVIGCGNLGSYIATLAGKSLSEPVIATYNSNKISLENVKTLKCDVTDINQLKELKELTDNDNLTVFWTAGYHNIDKCAQNKEYAEKVNIDSLKYFFDIFGKVKNFYFASSDCVYGESLNGEIFDSDSECHPINEYGRQKLKAEQIVLENGGTILRFSLMMGDTPSGKENFYHTIKHALENGEEIELICDSHRNSLRYIHAAASALGCYLNHTEKKILNICGNKSLSKYFIGKHIAKENNLDDSLIKPVSFDDFPSFKERRAKDIILKYDII